EDRAADRTGDSDGELEAGERMVRRKARDIAEQGAGLRDDARAVHRDAREAVAQLHDDAADSAVADEEIAAVTGDGKRNILLARQHNHAPEIFRRGRKHEGIRRAADTEGGVAAHRLVQVDFALADFGAQLLADLRVQSSLLRIDSRS